MPLEYALDHARRRVTVIGTDPVGLAETFALLDQQAAEGVWSYATLRDSRLLTWHPTTEQVRRLLDRIEQLSITHGPRGPAAIVATQPAVFGMARMFATLGEHRAVQIAQVFRDLDEAERWLDERQAPPA